MKATALACLVLATAAFSHASSTESAIVAAMKIADSPNYSWATNVDDDARSYEIVGQTDKADKADYSLVNLPMIAALHRRATRSSAPSDNEATAIYQGDEKVVIQTPDGWKKPGELTARSSYPSARPGGMSGMLGMGRRGRHGMGPGGGGYPHSENGDDSPTLAYSNLQLTLSRPHEEIAIIVANYTALQTEGDVVTGTLSELGAKLLLVHPGQTELTPLKAGGTFRLWVKDGTLVKYEVKLEGTLAVNVHGNRREVDVHQTATTELKNVGTTKFDVPDEAKKKLGA